MTDLTCPRDTASVPTSTAWVVRRQGCRPHRQGSFGPPWTTFLHRQASRREVKDFRRDGVLPAPYPATSRTLITAAKSAGVTGVRIQGTELFVGAGGGARGGRLCGMGLVWRGRATASARLLSRCVSSCRISDGSALPTARPRELLLGSEHGAAAPTATAAAKDQRPLPSPCLHHGHSPPSTRAAPTGGVARGSSGLERRSDRSLDAPGHAVTGERGTGDDDDHREV